MQHSEFSRHLKEIHQLAAKIHSDMASLLEEYLALGKRIFAMPIGVVGRIEGDRYVVVALSGEADELRAGQVFPLQETYCAEVVEGQRTVMVAHAGASVALRTHPAYAARHMESYISAPVLVDGTMYGTLNFSSPDVRPDGFGPFEQDLMEAIASDLGVILSLERRREEQRESEQLIKILSEAVEASNDGIAITDPHKSDNPLIYVNKAFENITGYSMSDVLGRNCRFLQAPDRDESALSRLRASIAAAQPCHVRLKNVKKNGRIFWNDFHLTPIFDRQNELKYFVGVQRDITRDVQKEEMLLASTQQRRELMLVAQEILSAVTEETVVRVIVDRLEHILPYDTAAIYIADDREKMLRPIAVVGPQWHSPDLTEWAIPQGTGIIGAIVASKNGELVNNAHLDPRSVYPSGAPIRQEHLIVQPLRSGETVWGAFVVNRMSDRPFTAIEYETAQFLTSYASLSLHNISLIGRLRESEQSLRDVLETISDGVVSIDTEGTILYANDGLERIFGYTGHEAVGTSLDQLVPEFHRSLRRERPKRSSETGALPEGNAMQLDGRHKSGRTIPLEVSFGESERDGRRFFTGIIRDITERKRAEDLLRATTTRLIALIQNIHAGVLVEDETRTISLINRTFCSMFGIPVPPEVLVGTDCSQSAEQSKGLFRDPEVFVRRIDTLLKDRVIVTNEECVLADGRVYERDYIPIYIGDDYRGHMWLYRDISARKHNEEEMEKLARFTNENPNPVFRVSHDHRILYMNDPARRMLTEVGAQRADVVPPGWQAIIDNALLNDRTTEFELSAEAGTPIYLTHFVPVRSAGYVNVYSRDITERKIAEWEAMKAKALAEESMQAKQDFLAKMSHELRTPMNAVLGLTNLILNTPLTNEQSSMVEGIRASGRNLLVIINDILDLAKIEAGKLTIDRTDFLVRGMVEDIRVAMHPLAQQKGITFDCTVDADVPDVLTGDPVRIGQIIINLFSNAIKFTEHGGVTFRCSRERAADGSVHLLMEVSDTGIGIPEKKLATIFEAFGQASQEISARFGGTGLGLTIVRQLVGLMQGDITVRSTPGAGSTFSVRLPLIRGLANAQKLSQRTKSAGPAFEQLSGTVLLVEDNVTNQLVAVKTLEMWGVVVDVADDGEAALALLKSRTYDLVLMDIQMPGIDGFETTRRIRTDFGEPVRSIPVYAMTASVLNDPEGRAVKSGMQGYISKPFELPDLYKTVALHLRCESPVEPPRAPAEEPLPPSGYRHLDLSMLESISPGNMKFVRKMVDIFERNTPMYLAAMRTAYEQNDYKEVKRNAHTMKPTGAYIGVDALKPNAEEIERLAELANEPAALGVQVDRLEKLCGEVMVDLRRWKELNP